MEKDIFKFICANQGAVNTDELLFNLCNGDALSEIIGKKEKFVSCCPHGQPRVVARTRLRLCRAQDCHGCGGLHLCKHYLFSGSCKFSLLGRRCKFSHELNSHQNQTTLKEFELEMLDRAELCTLLLQSDNAFLPPICYDYNNSQCNEGDACKRLHICEKYMRVNCSCTKNHNFNAPQPLKCLQERHVPEDQMHVLKSVYSNKEALRFSDKISSRGNTGNRGNRRNRGNRGNSHQLPRGLSTSDNFDDIDHMDVICAGGPAITAASETDTSSEGGPSRNLAFTRGRGSKGNRGNWGNRGNAQQLKQYRSTSDICAAVKNPNDDKQRQKIVKDKTEICMFFIKGSCKHEERCYRLHDKMPYRWQIKQGDQWTAMAKNEEIEKDYCDPKNTYSNTHPQVDFDTMTCGSDKVRRISTINCVREPTYIHTTEWVWYWEDEFGDWKEYASPSAQQKSADINSKQLEEKFLSNDQDVVEFTASSQSYSLSFQDMIQTNINYGTKKLVRRRPRFVSETDVRTQRVRRPQSNITDVPDYWDKTQIPSAGYKRIILQPSSKEYKEIEKLFCQTLTGFHIVKMERIQNKALWEEYQLQKKHIKDKNNGRMVTEKKLFHGTDSKFVETICANNFDWRLCGVNGTAYGQGSYFARDARYSHCYTGKSEVRSMFVSRVLVGDFTLGYSDYKRPPPKDSSNLNFYNSCVNDEADPSIFVVFEKQQIYPEYVLQYKEKHSTVSVGYGAAATSRSVARPRQVVASAPVTAPKPATPFYQPTTSSYMYQTDRASTTDPVTLPTFVSPISTTNTKKKESDSCVIA